MPTQNIGLAKPLQTDTYLGVRIQAEKKASPPIGW